MGNCFYLQKRSIKVMKADGEIVEYRAPMKVRQLLAEYAGHAVSKTMPVVKPLQPQDDMFSGQLYYLRQLEVSSLVLDKKNIQHSNSKVVESKKSSGVLRIKLMIRKDELEVMLSKGGVLVSDMVYQIQKIQRAQTVDKLDKEGPKICKSWKPVLQSIPEVD